MAAAAQCRAARAPPRRHYFRNMMNDSVHLLIEKAPLRVAKILIEAVSHLIALKFHDEEGDISGCDIWYKSIRMRYDSGEEHKLSKMHDEVLIDTMTLACRKVYEKQADKIEELDKILRNEKREFFQQLRMRLYTEYPASAKPWIRELILTHEGYGTNPFAQNFWDMIKSACEKFGEELLTRAELTEIFEAINEVQLDEQQKQMYTEDNLRYWQLSPFECLLFGNYRDIYQQLKATVAEEKKEEPAHHRPSHTDRMAMSDHSPFSHEELASWSDEKLLDNINTWDSEEKFIKNDNIVVVNKNGFAVMFYGVFKQSITSDPSRINFWQQRCNEIKHPVYVREMLCAMRDVEAGQHEMIDKYLMISEKILARAEEEYRSEKSKRREHRELDWSSARWPICELVSEYLKKKIEPRPLVWKRLGTVLTMLCNQYDHDLDDEQHHDRYRSANRGLNCIRGRSLIALVDFALVAKKYKASSYISVAKKIIEQRLSAQAEHTLKPEEHAILGGNYLRLHFLDKEWTREHKQAFFPQDNLPAWVAAFSTFISYCEPSKAMFEIISENFAFAMQNLDEFRTEDNYGNAVLNDFERKLFEFYLFGKYQLVGDDSLLDQYYQKTASDKKRRGDLLYRVGDSLRDKDKQFNNETTEKILAFFRARLVAKDFVKMDSFSPWLEVEQLTIEERLSACLEVVKICKIESIPTNVWLKKFCKMLPDHNAEVVKCFTELVCRKNSNILRIDEESVKIIVTAGRKSSDEETVNNVNRAVSCLLRKRLIRLDKLED